MSTELWTAGSAVTVALIGAGELRRIHRTRSERRTDDASTMLLIQEATKNAVQTVTKSAHEAVEWARNEAKWAKDQADEAHREMRDLQVELMQARKDLVKLRADMEAEREAFRQAAARREAELNATILAQQSEIQRLRADVWPMTEPRSPTLGN